VLLCGLLLSGTFLGLAAHGSMPLSLPWLNRQVLTLMPTNLLSIQLQRNEVPVPEAERVAQRFLGAMQQKNWREMWLFMYPDAQQRWQNESDFVRFEQSKFGSLTFGEGKVGPARLQQPWRDPNTTLLYPFAALVHVSLRLTARPGVLSVPSAFALAHGLFANTLIALVFHQGYWQVLDAGPADLDAPILVPANPRPVELSVPIFMYHHISQKPTHDLLDYNLTVTTSDFNQQLNWLEQSGYHSITQTELFDALYYGKALPPHPMMLTFDDGYEDAYTDALPVLLAHHYRGVFYIITGMIGGNYLTWRQVRLLMQAGMQISSHTVHHVNIGEPPPGTSTQTELLLSKHTLEAQLGEPIQFFCYPTGEPFHHDTPAEQRIVLADLFQDGYVSATLDPFSLFSTIQNAQTPYQLNRVRVSGGESLSAFTGILLATLRRATLLLQS
jgi:peptidoglycan/xylan/chitin deacetylase (PgdA/CDA1 family)